MPLNATATGILQSLGWAILHSFWQMALIWLVYYLLFGWHRRFSPALKHNAAGAFLTFGTLWFVATFSNEYTKFLQVGQYLPAMPEPGGESSPQSGISMSLAGWSLWLQDFAERNIAWLSAVYLMITTLTGWKLLFSLWMVRQLKIKGIQPADTALSQLTDALANQLHIHPKVSTFISERVDVPATFGYLKPVILLPAAALAQLSPAQLESVILHELAHIRRADYLVNILVSVMETIMVHNPFAWLLVKAIRTERELCCDDIVLSRNQDILAYASALLTLEKNRVIPQLSMALAGNGQRGQLLARVQRMVEPGRANPVVAHRLMGIVFMGLLLVLMAWGIPETTAAETRKEILVEKQLRPELNEGSVAEIPFVIEREKDPIDSRKKEKKKIRAIEKPLAELGETDFLHLETPMDRTMPVFPAPSMEQAFYFNFQEPVHDPVLRQHTELELQKLIERTEKIRAGTPASREKQLVFVDDAFRGFEEISPGAMFEIEKQEWGQFAERAKILHEEQVLKQQKLARIYQAPMMIYRNETQKATSPRVVQKSRAMGPPTETKIRKIKTSDGFILRIETGKESVDIRIAEDDLVVEGNGEDH